MVVPLQLIKVMIGCDFSWKIKEENDRSVDIQFFIVILHKFKLLGATNPQTNKVVCVANEIQTRTRHHRMLRRCAISNYKDELFCQLQINNKDKS